MIDCCSNKLFNVIWRCYLLGFLYSTEHFLKKKKKKKNWTAKGAVQRFFGPSKNFFGRPFGRLDGPLANTLPGDTFAVAGDRAI